MGRGSFEQNLLQSKRRSNPENELESADLRAPARDFWPVELKNVCNLYSSRRGLKKAACRGEKCSQYLLQSEISDFGQKSMQYLLQSRYCL